MHMWTRRTMALAISLAVIGCASAQAGRPGEPPGAPPPPPAQQLGMFAGVGAPITLPDGSVRETRWVYLSWTPSCNAKGCADAYRVQFIIGGVTQPLRTVTGTRDSAQVTLPVPPGTVTVSGSVVAVRRGIPSPATASRTMTLAQEDEAPPAVDSVKIDTLPPATDLGLAALTVGQAVWSDSGPNAATLVANRDAIVRAWVQGDSLAPPRLTLTAVQANGQRDTLIVARATQIGSSPSPLNASYIASLPAALVQPGVRVDAALRVLDSSAANNTASATLAVQRVPNIRIHLVPVNNVGRVATITAAMRRDARDWAMRVWPLHDVEVTVHDSAFLSKADTLRSNDSNGAWLTILSEMNLLRAQMPLPSHAHIAGVLPVTFGSGIAGYAYVGGKAMVVWNQSGTWGRVYAHELGHNFGRRHVAACGSGNTDANYPYASGRVGVHGYNGSLVTPTSHTDVMGYCSTQHVSDYSWRGVMAHRGVAQAFDVFASWFAEPPQRSVILSAVLFANDVRLSASIDTAVPRIPVPGPITIALFDGESLVRELTARTDDVDHATARLLTAWIPTDARVTRVVLTRADGGLPLRTEVAL